jgi:hypothetical protein
MVRFIRRVLFALGLALTILGVVLAIDLQDLGVPAWKAKGLWAFLAGGMVFLLLGWRAKPGVVIKLFLLLCGCGLVEALLQASAWLGVLPAVNTKERLPWGRVYWTVEGRGNSIRNRHGWHFPAFDLGQTNRTAVIGDSFVEAVEVRRTRNMAALLAGKLRAEKVPRTVLGLGNHGTGPAHYLEVLKYGHRRFGIDEAIIVVYLGNDISDCSARLHFRPASYLYYSLEADRQLRLDATGEAVRAVYYRNFELLDRPAWLFLPRLAISHCMAVQLPLSVSKNLAMRKAVQAEVSQAAGFEAETSRLGLKTEAFATKPSPAAREGFEILEALLERSAQFAGSNGIRLKLVTVPFLPQEFYASQGTNWSGALGDYDFLAPERELVRWAEQRKIPLLALGAEMKRRQMTTEEIRKLYFSNGSGHFSEAGHRLAAEAMDEAFYQQPR